MSFESSINIYNFFQNSAQNTTKIKPDEAENSGIPRKGFGVYGSSPPEPKSMYEKYWYPWCSGGEGKNRKKTNILAVLTSMSTPMAETYLIVTYEYYDMALKNWFMVINSQW